MYQSIKNCIVSIWENSSGATLIEYGVALTVAIIVGASAISILGEEVADALTETASAF